MKTPRRPLMFVARAAFAAGALAACAVGSSPRTAAPAPDVGEEEFSSLKRGPAKEAPPPSAEPTAPMGDVKVQADPAASAAPPVNKTPADTGAAAGGLGAPGAASKKAISLDGMTKDEAVSAPRPATVALLASEKSSASYAKAKRAEGADAEPARKPAATRDDDSSAREADAPRQRSGLQGGSRDDVGQRADYLSYMASMRHVRARPVDVSQRVLVQVKDDLEQGLPNAQVRVLKDGRQVTQLTSYADGRVAFYPRAAGLAGNEKLDLEITSQGTTRTRSLTLSGRDEVMSVVVPAVAQRKAPTVDVMFVLDTTGSMGDEIARIQLTLLDVAARIQRLEQGATVRYGLTLYRDHGDAYVTRVHDFTTDTHAFLRLLETVEADGGGDTPEAMDEGLNAAIQQASWTPRETPNALRLAILVADAPPHVDGRQGQGPDYVREMRAAAERGIKIFPVAASGLDDQGEFIFRQVAHHTMARFVFITYGGGTSHHVGQFANNNLDDLVVGLVADELADLTGRARASVRALAMAH